MSRGTMLERRPGFFRQDTLPGRRAQGKVKWFDAGKGFGFLTFSDGSPDAFLPMAVLRRAGYPEVPEGALITCEIGTGEKGPLVTAVLTVDSSTPAASFGKNDGYDRRRPRPPTTLDGTVKRFDAARGYGFISPDGGGKDIFIHITALRRSGVSALDPGQRVRAEIVDGKQGAEAERITLI
ncbi:MAG TPA: cold shock domain-containing protein [Stellaceae bacterium]|nr:cold shock domain-containing protein [Stellaceae bacterium]